MAEATLDSIAGLIFQRLGVEGLRELFSNPEFCFFRDEIIAIGDQLKAHGLTDAAEAMYEISKDFPKCPRTNPYSPTNPNWQWWEDNLGRAERNGEAAEFRVRYRHLQKDRLRVERGIPPMCGSFANERPWGKSDERLTPYMTPLQWAIDKARREAATADREKRVGTPTATDVEERSSSRSASHASRRSRRSYGHRRSGNKKGRRTERRTRLSAFRFLLSA